MTNQHEATDDILTLFRVGWVANSLDVTGYIPEIEWPGGEAKNPKQRDKAWTRVVVRHSQAPQRTFGTQAVRERFGIIVVQIFVSSQRNPDMKLVTDLGEVVRTIFEGKKTPLGVWFRNVRIEELPPMGGWLQVNMTAEFNWDTLT